MNWKGSCSPFCRVCVLLTTYFITLLCPMALTASEMTQVEAQFWSSVYGIVHPGGDAPSWPPGGPHAWAKLHEKAVDKAVGEILGGRLEGVPWQHGLFAARVVQGPSICNELWVRYGQIARISATEVGQWTRSNCAMLEGVVEPLARCGDIRVVSGVNSALASDACSKRSTLLLLSVLRKIGDESALIAVKALANRQTDSELQREAVLTEKVFVARVAGRDVLENAQRELRKLTHAWIEAIDAKDMQAYLNVLPSLARSGVDEHDFKVELLQAPELPAILEAAKRAAEAGDDAFRFNRERLDASIVVDGRYRFLYVLEGDGWKIFGPVGVGP